MIEIDGSYGSGGGQMVRTALALSTVLGKPFHMVSIRQNRVDKRTGKVGGLKPQHLTCVKSLQDLCGAEVKGASLGSSELTFKPGKIKGRTLGIDIGTAGSITLLMQALLLPCISSGEKIRLKIKGGTDVSWSMPIDYFSEVLLPQLRRYADIDFKLELRGYYPKGNGRVDIKIKKKEECGVLNLIDQGHIIQIKGVAHASSDLAGAEVAERMARAAKRKLAEFDVPINIRTEYQDTLSDGAGITLWAICSKDPEDIDFVNPIRLGADSLGARGKRAEQVAEECAQQLIEELSRNCAVDSHLADNLIPFLGLFGGSIKVSKITEHTRTNIFIVEQFIGAVFTVDEAQNTISAEKAPIASE